MKSRRLKNNGKWTIFKLLLCIYLIGGLFSIVGLRASVVNIEYDLADLGRQKEALVRQSKLLVAQRASLYSSRKVEDIAIAKLGMQFAKREDVIFVRKEPDVGIFRASLDAGQARVSPATERF